MRHFLRFKTPLLRPCSFRSVAGKQLRIFAKLGRVGGAPYGQPSRETTSPLGTAEEKDFATERPSGGAV
jgi:hypothetical protein